MSFFFIMPLPLSLLSASDHYEDKGCCLASGQLSRSSYSCDPSTTSLRHLEEHPGLYILGKERSQGENKSISLSGCGVNCSRYSVQRY